LPRDTSPETSSPDAVFGNQLLDRFEDQLRPALLGIQGKLQKDRLRILGPADAVRRGHQALAGLQRQFQPDRPGRSASIDQREPLPGDVVPDGDLGMGFEEFDRSCIIMIQASASRGRTATTADSDPARSKKLFMPETMQEACRDGAGKNRIRRDTAKVSGQIPIWRMRRAR
jgi:hypothetical protein